MDVDDARLWWNFLPGLQSEEDLVKCPDEDCGKESPLKEWTVGSVGCELCGDHDAMVCPECEEMFDHVWSPTFEVTHVS